MPESVEQLLPAFEASLEDARAFLRGFGAEAAAAPWRLSEHGKEVFTIPRGAMIRTLSADEKLFG
ncbi:MAG: hypothetical protein H0X69_07945 [Gemmatimonadales bacterium]|nr:hypothetical protein [Gemmatimonadales bacterium]